MRLDQPANHPRDVSSFLSPAHDPAGLRIERAKAHGGIWQKPRRARAIEEGAALFDAQCSRCHGTQGKGIPGLCPPLNDRYFFDQRLKDVSWSGTMEDYIVATASSGRLASTRPQLLPGQGMPAMPSFSDQYGGPLRQDQIRSIAALYHELGRNRRSWSSCPPHPPDHRSVRTSPRRCQKATPRHGEAAGDHAWAAPPATSWRPPDRPGWQRHGPARDRDARRRTRLERTRLHRESRAPPNSICSNRSSTRMSISRPGFSQGLMPGAYATTLTDQNMADLIAYLLTLK